MSVDNLGIKTNEKFELKKILIDKSNLTLDQKSEAKTKPNFDTLNVSDVQTMSSTTDRLVTSNKQ